MLCLIVNIINQSINCSELFAVAWFHSSFGFIRAIKIVVIVFIIVVCANLFFAMTWDRFFGSQLTPRSNPESAGIWFGEQSFDSGFRFDWIALEDNSICHPIDQYQHCFVPLFHPIPPSIRNLAIVSLPDRIFKGKKLCQTETQRYIRHPLTYWNRPAKSQRPSQLLQRPYQLAVRPSQLALNPPNWHKGPPSWQCGSSTQLQGPPVQLWAPSSWVWAPTRCLSPIV